MTTLALVGNSELDMMIQPYWGYQAGIIVSLLINAISTAFGDFRKAIDGAGKNGSIPANKETDWFQSDTLGYTGALE